MFKYLVPRIALGDLPSICGVALIGAVIAGVYGVIHDQITYAISPEYFTHIKFKQFHFADVGLGDRAFVATIGFLAASSVGLIIAWFLARLLIPQCQLLGRSNRVDRRIGNYSATSQRP